MNERQKMRSPVVCIATSRDIATSGDIATSRNIATSADIATSGDIAMSRKQIMYTYRQLITNLSHSF
jgi:hypothetical protein